MCMDCNSATFLKYTSKQVHIYWVTVSHATKQERGRVQSVGAAVQGCLGNKNCIMMVKMHSIYMNKVTSTGSEHQQCCLELLGLQMKCYSSRPEEMNEPYVTGYMVPYSDCNWDDWFQRFTLQMGCDYTFCL